MNALLTEVNRLERVGIQVPESVGVLAKRTAERAALVEALVEALEYSIEYLESPPFVALHGPTAVAKARAALALAKGGAK